MTDYKELAARLRRKANLTEHVHVAREFRAAADAIEELMNAKTHESCTDCPNKLPCGWCRTFDAPCSWEEEATPNVLEKPTGWTPVSERVPEETGWYLVTMGGESRIMWYSRGHGFESYQGIPITAWMPLPEPYKEGEKG